MLRQLSKLIALGRPAVGMAVDRSPVPVLAALHHETIRAFARGVHPRRLDDEEGLAAAIAELAGITTSAGHNHLGQDSTS